MSEAALLPRQLIVCCDGTNNNVTGRQRDTNVVKLCELLDPSAQQLLYYDPGVGNPGILPSATEEGSFRSDYERLKGLAFGSGVYENIAEGYRFLMRRYELGDDIFLFGFSRGAFTARAIGGLVNRFGLLRPEHESMVDTLVHLYFDKKSVSGAPGEAHHKAMVKQVKELYVGDLRSNVTLTFTGVWDTVESVGLIPRSNHQKPVVAGKQFLHVRHAVSLDEYRRPFRPRLYIIESPSAYDPQQSIKQRCFSGDHCDVGGGHAREESGLSNESLLWIVEEAVEKGLTLKARFMNGSAVDAAAVIQQIQASPDGNTTVRRFAHSQLFKTPLWALAGMTTRSATADVEGGVVNNAPWSAPAFKPLRFPEDTVWSHPSLDSDGGWLSWLVGFVVLFGLYVIASSLLMSPAAAFYTSLWDALKGAPHFFSEAKAAWLGLNSWQLCPKFAGPPAPGGSLVAATVVDFLIILAYGALLGRVARWAFSELAQLRVPGQATNRILNTFGLFLTTMVVADVAENILMLLWAYSHDNPYLPWAGVVLRWLIALATALKWLGFCGVLTLIAAGSIKRLRRFWAG